MLAQLRAVPDAAAMRDGIIAAERTVLADRKPPPDDAGIFRLVLSDNNSACMPPLRRQARWRQLAVVRAFNT
jgi:hypothetical protein